MARSAWEHYGLENQSFHSNPSAKEVQLSEALLRGVGSCDLYTAIVRLGVRGAVQITLHHGKGDGNIKEIGRLSSRSRVVKFTNLIMIFMSYHYFLSSPDCPFAHFLQHGIVQRTYLFHKVLPAVHETGLNLLGC